VAFNNLVGIKPTRGLLSTAGVVPACRSLDCVGVFALDFPDAEAVMAVGARYDADDPFARPGRSGRGAREAFRFGVPADDQLEFLGDGEYERLFREAVARLEGLGGRAVTVDFGPFAEAARLRYEGPWVAERYAAIRELIERQPEALHPVTRAIIEPGRQAGAVEAFEAQYRLLALRRQVEPILAEVDFVVTPTAPTCYRVGEVEREPVVLNSRLGVYTNFMNLLDLAAVAVPAGFRRDGMPFGVTLFADAFSDGALAGHGDRLQRASELPRGATGLARREAALVGGGSEDRGMLPLVVCGAHMEGLPLSSQLLERGGRLVRRTRTAACYRLFVLPGGPPARPGLVRDEAGGGWDRGGGLGAAQGGGRGVPGGDSGAAGDRDGTVELEGGTREKGFTCEGYGTLGAEEITRFGGWRAWLAATR